MTTTQTEPELRIPPTWTQSFEDGEYVRIFSDGTKQQGPPIFISQRERLGRYQIKVAYHQRFVAELKRRIPGDHRDYIGATSTWLIAKSFAHVARMLIEKYVEWPAVVEDFDAYTKRMATIQTEANQATQRTTRPAMPSQPCIITDAAMHRETLRRQGMEYDRLRSQLFKLKDDMDATKAATEAAELEGR